MADEPITRENGQRCTNCGMLRKKGDPYPFVCMLPFPGGHRWLALDEEEPTRLNMNGSPITVTALAWIANTLDTHGEVHVTHCAKALMPGMGAVNLGAELQRLGFFDVLKKQDEQDERNEAHETIEGMEGQ